VETDADVHGDHWEIHTAVLDTPGDIMSVTLPRGSRLERRTDTWRRRLGGGDADQVTPKALS
jgi:hypothetical protein